MRWPRSWTWTIRRRVARVILLDPAGRVLLFHLDPGRDPDGRGYWYLPGGGMNWRESVERAARRELLEETGIAEVDLGPLVAHVTGVSYLYRGSRFEQDEWHVVGRVSADSVVAGLESDAEHAAVAAHRWWSVDDLATAGEVVYPRELPRLVRHLAEEGPPAVPWELRG